MFESRVRFHLAWLGAACLAGACGSPGRIDIDPASAPQTEKPEPPGFLDPEPARPLPVVQDGKLLLSDSVSFETVSEVVRARSALVLDDVKRFLEARPDVTLLRIEAHTDDGGDDGENQKISERRALAVASWLVTQGIDCRRLLPVGFGQTKPVAANDTPAGRAQNRRIEFAVAALRSRPIEGMPVDGGGTIAGDPCH